MIKMTGFTEIDKVIRQLPHQLNHTILQQIHARAVRPYIKAAYFAAPLKSGKTAESIGVIRPGRNRAGSVGLIIAGPRRGRFGGNVAHLAEFGTKQRRLIGRGQYRSGTNRGTMPRRPFLRPSWDRTQNQVLEGIRVATGQVVYNFMKRTIKRYG